MSMQQNYDPSKNYYMLDYMDMETISHIRMPYMTEVEIYVYLGQMLRADAKIRDLRILPETFLDQKRKAQYDMDKQEYVEDTITNRQYYFDDRYEGIANSFKKGRIFA